MKTFLAFLTEARRNPEKNLKISLWDVFEKYKNDKDVYISFVSDVGKGSHKEVTKKTEEGKPDTSKETVLGGAIASALGQLDNKYRQLRRLRNVPNRNVSGFKIGINPKSKYATPNGIYTYPLKKAWGRYRNEKARILDVPFVGEQPAVYFLRPKGKTLDVSNMRTPEMIKLSEKLIKMLVKMNPHSKDKVKKEVKELMNHAGATARVRSAGGIFWNMTRCAAEWIAGNVQTSTDNKGRLQFEIPEHGKNSANHWNKIFRDLGYIGATDNDETGIIHPAEPMQAVFFDKTQVEVVDFALNKNYAPNKVDKTKTKWLNYPNDAGVFANFMSAVYAVYEAQDYEFDFGKAKWNILNLSYVTMYRNRVLDGDKEMWIKIAGSFHDILETTPEEWKNKKLMKKKWGDGMLEDSVCIYSTKDENNLDPDIEIDMEYVVFRLPKGKKFADGKSIHSADHFEHVVKGGIKNYLEKLFDGVK
jgi:hypothetical protein